MFLFLMVEKRVFSTTLSVWQQRGIIDSYDLSIAYWSERTNNRPGIPPPPPPPSGTTLSVKGEGSTGKEYTSFM